MEALISTIKALSTRLDALESKIYEPKLQIDNLLHLPTTIKLDITRFNGEEPLGWIFKVNQFFDYHRTINEQWLRISLLYMEGEALRWYQWMHSNGQLSSWAAFLQSMELQFVPSDFDDPQGVLFKLAQTNSVREYQAQFENFANHVNGLSAPFYLSCFIFGLKLEIRHEVIPFQPNLLFEVINLAKLQEEKIFAAKPKFGYTIMATKFHLKSLLLLQRQECQDHQSQPPT